jgi:FlaA1/EpsC-like NDP-sugar epimerase
MKILKFTGQLLDVMGDDAHKDWLKVLGLKFHSGHQTEDGKITLMEVVDESKCAKYMDLAGVEVLTPAEANALIAEQMDREDYIITSESIVSANLLHSLEKLKEAKLKGKDVKSLGLLDMDEMPSDWDEQQELKYLYDKGISGIKKTKKVSHRFGI